MASCPRNSARTAQLWPLAGMNWGAEMFYEDRGPDVGPGVGESMVSPAEARIRRRDLKTSTFYKTKLQSAKRAFTTRRADLSLARRLLTEGVGPTAGDLLLARVEAIRHHARIELVEGRRSALYVGDEIIVAYGARYAPDQFEAVVPDDLLACDLIAGGGVAGRVIARHSKTKVPTRIQPLGLIADLHSAPLNLARFALPETLMNWQPAVIAVCGTSMNAAKATTGAAAHLIKGLRRAGLKVGAAIVGTGSGGELWSMTDAGACPVYDFTDMGHASTFKVKPDELERVALQLIDHVAAARCDIVVLDVANSLFQAETAALLTSPAFRDRLKALVLASGDAMGAAFGVNWLRSHGLPVVAVSGMVAASPLGRQEAIAATGLPVAAISELADAGQMTQIVFNGAVDIDLVAVKAEDAPAVGFRRSAADGADLQRNRTRRARADGTTFYAKGFPAPD